MSCRDRPVIPLDLSRLRDQGPGAPFRNVGGDREAGAVSQRVLGKLVATMLLGEESGVGVARPTGLTKRPATTVPAAATKHIPRRVRVGVTANSPGSLELLHGLIRFTRQPMASRRNAPLAGKRGEEGSPTTG